MPKERVGQSRINKFNTRINEASEKIYRSPKTRVAVYIIIPVVALTAALGFQPFGDEVAADQPSVSVVTTSSSSLTTGIVSVPPTSAPRPLATTSLPTAPPTTTSTTTTTTPPPTDPCDLALGFDAPTSESLDLDRLLVRWELGRVVLESSECAFRFTHNDEWSLDRSLTGSIGGPGSGYTLVVEDELIISATFAIGAPDAETTTQRAVEFLLTLVIDGSTDGGLFENGFESRCTGGHKEFWGVSDISESALEVERCDESAPPSP